MLALLVPLPPRLRFDAQVEDRGKREYDPMGSFVGFNAKKKVQPPRNYFIDYNETADSFDVRPDGTYKGYGTPDRKAWLAKHTKRILHDFQVHQGGM